MNELETMRRAQQYIEQLAQGIDPLTGQEMSEDAVLNQPRLVRCFFYVAGVLKENADRLERSDRTRTKKPEFYLTPEERSAIAGSAAPVTVSVLVQAINEAVGGGETRKKLPTTAVTAWLVEKGFLKELETAPGKRRKTVTPLAATIGILEEERQGQYGIYNSILYTADAQNFILDNMQDILDLRAASRE